jgi:hypothetical protein
VKKTVILPNALVRAFENHFVYEREITNHLRNIPFFIQKTITDVCPQYEALSLLKRFTGYLLGYVLHKSETELFILIPCAKRERKEIRLLLGDCLGNINVTDNIPFTVHIVFIGEEVFPNIIIDTIKIII